MPDAHDPRHSAVQLAAGPAQPLPSAPGLETRELVGKLPGAGLFDLASTQDGSHTCIFCGVCAKRCPVSCISVRRDARSKGEGRRSQYLGSIVVDEPRCIACGRCVRACALNALVPTPGYEEHRRHWHARAAEQTMLASGHGTCSGCAAPVVVRQVLSAVRGHHVVAGATGCLEVSTTRYPYTSWKGSYIHTNFENAAATLSGVETAFRALRRRGRLQDHVKFVAFGGDGGTYDIGLQALSGAMERGHSMLYVCYDNGGYMNTGFQRSSATPANAWTSTSPVGEASDGKLQMSKNLTEIMVGHRVPYVAQASPHDPRDLMRKAAKALSIDGPTFLNVLSPCPRGWRTENDEAMSLARLAADTCYWPLFEVEEGRYRLDYRPRAKQPIAAWLERQGRFAHLARPEAEPIVARLQRWIDAEWELLLRKCDEIPEEQWRTTKDRRSSRLSLTPRPLHHTALGEPLTASMTSNTIDWGAWGATPSAFSWGVFDD
jgi:pyruvate ferredoxin oxidoreductase beta subunit